MKLEEYIPAELLRPFIKTYRIIESQDEITNRVLPSTSLTIAFRYKGQVSYKSDNSENILPDSTISGLRKSVRLIHYVKETATIIVLFKEAGAKAFFEEPIYELFEESISFDTFIRQKRMSGIEEQLAEAKNNLDRIAIIDQFLLSRLCNYSSDKLISAAVEKIHFSNGMIKIKKLADTLYISNDAFEKRFREVIGTSPKQFSSIVRMEAITKQKMKAGSFADIAFNAGYYDQPHFNKDFKLFTGLTPTDFFKKPFFW
ncbi:MAG: AraC family transcriptional regulator [Bacteroidetes bacterium]|nr:AraC family transcriptional regulator [Bacteroidota bacterium]